MANPYQQPTGAFALERLHVLSTSAEVHVVKSPEGLMTLGAVGLLRSRSLRLISVAAVVFDLETHELRVYGGVLQ